MGADRAPSCPTCGGELIGGSRFCGRCGTPQSMSAKMGVVPPPPPSAQPPLPNAWAAHVSPPAPAQPGSPFARPPQAQPPYAQPPQAQPPYAPPQAPPYGAPPSPYQPAPYPPPPPRTDRRGWKTALAILLVGVLVGGGAVAGILVVRSGGGHPSFLACPGGVCPRFPVDKLTRLEIRDAAFGRVRLAVPPGALREPTELTVRPAPPAARPPRIADGAGGGEPTMVGPIVDLGPDGQTFEQPLRLELPVDTAKVPADAQVAVVTWDGTVAERLEPIAFDREAGTVTVETRHFSQVAVILDPGAGATFVVGPPPPPPPPPPCPPVERRAEKCPWTPDGYAVGECTPGFCWDGGPQGFLACKQIVTPPGAALGENRNPYCPSSAPIYDRCSGVLTGCEPPPPPPPSPPVPTP